MCLVKKKTEKPLAVSASVHDRKSQKVEPRKILVFSITLLTEGFMWKRDNNGENRTALID